MKELLKRYNEILVKAVKADLEGQTRNADFLFGTASGMMSSAYVMFDILGTDTVARMSRSLGLAYDIVMGEVEDEEESIYILENNMA